MAYECATSPVRYMHGVVSVAANQSITLACRVYETGGTSSTVETSIGLFVSTSNSRYLWGTTRGYDGNKRCNRVIWANDSGSSGLAGSADIRNQWNSLVIVVNSSSDIQLYTNGVDDGSLSTSDTMWTGTYDRIGIGSEYRSGSPSLYYLGDLAECAVWEDELTLEDAKALQMYSPRFIKPATLKYYWPLIRGFHGEEGGVTLTDVGTPILKDHPPVIEHVGQLQLPNYSEAAAPITVPKAYPRIFGPGGF
jgi:hypothetical protein